MISAFEMFDEATDRRYTDVVTKRIKRHKYILAVMRHDLKTIKSDELIDMYKAHKWYYKVALHIRCYFPTIYSTVLKPIIRKIHTEY